MKSRDAASRSDEAWSIVIASRRTSSGFMGAVLIGELAPSGEEFIVGLAQGFRVAHQGCCVGSSGRRDLVWAGPTASAIFATECADVETLTRLPARGRPETMLRHIVSLIPSTAATLRTDTGGTAARRRDSIKATAGSGTKGASPLGISRGFGSWEGSIWTGLPADSTR